ncbi:MAG: glycoside hydrolase family 13 protein [Clostridia bacterium]|nr:glycoside hydrolase family 13 protein [Clostridia bacterium]
MLPTFYRDYDRDAMPRIQKTVLGEDASMMGAFSFGTRINVRIHTPRRLGAAAVVLRLQKDGENDRDMPLSFVTTEGGTDVCEITLDTSLLCGEDGHGLFYYEFLFVRGADTLFTNSINNVDFSLSDHSASRFRLLVHTADFAPPSWFAGGVMYHIFVDRFCRGKGHAPLRRGATLEPDWDHGIPQYAAYPGAPLANDLFFGGNLWGVVEKLDYLQSLGVTVLYLSPIFDAASNHKYDTGDYETVDAAFGGEAAFDLLLKETKKRGMRVILDGVFNHTGDDSRYFNRRGNYDTVGAYQSPDSPYFDWYDFKQYPEDYESWWGIKILPRLKSALPPVLSYLAGADGIAARRVRAGVAGWRLDVADELSDDFLETLRKSLHAASDEQPLIIGEVWENAVEKQAYGKRRHYFDGYQLDSVMNYPVRNALIAFVRDGDAEQLYHTLTELYASYPRAVCNCLMNFLGTHDTERILTVLGDPHIGDSRTNVELSVARLNTPQRTLAIKRLHTALTLLFTVFGVPSLFYGDEAGMEGHHDPFCRRPFPWGREVLSLVDHVRFLSKLRGAHTCFGTGEFRILRHGVHTIAYERRLENEVFVIAANMGGEEWLYPLSGIWQLLSADRTQTVRGCVHIGSGEAVVLREVRA